jgi:hypothetical protein
VLGQIKIDPRFLVPNGIALGFHFLIVILFGLGISGEHAHVMALSSVWAVLICLRGDIFLLLTPDRQLNDAFLYGTVFTVTVSLLLILIFSLINLPSVAFSPGVIACGSLVALNELIAATYLKENKMWRFIAIKSLPYPAFLAALMLKSTYTVVELWLSALMLTLIILGAAPLISLVTIRWRERIRFSQYLDHVIGLLPPTLATFVVIFLSNISVVLITELYGAVEAGIWINCYRILFLPMFYLSSALQVSMAKGLSEKDDEASMWRPIAKTWESIERVSIIYILLLLLISIFIFQSSSNDHGQQYLFPAMAALGYGLFRMYVQFLATAMQAIQKNRVTLSILSLELSLIVGFIFLGSSTATQFYAFILIYAPVLYLFVRVYLNSRFTRDGATDKIKP